MHMLMQESTAHTSPADDKRLQEEEKKNTN